MLDWFLKLFSGLLTPTIGITVAYIAWRQYQTAKDKLRLDLFDRRYRVYHALMKFVSKAAHETPLTSETLEEFYSDTLDYQFLFGSEIREYVRGIRRQSSVLLGFQQGLQHGSLPQDKQNIANAQLRELSEWFDQQFDEAPKLFEPYLAFDHRLG